MLPPLGIMTAGETKINQRIQIGVRDRKDMTAPAPVTTIGAAEFFVFFMAKRDAASPAVSRRDFNIGFVNEFHGFRLYKRKTPRNAQGLDSGLSAI